MKLEELLRPMRLVCLHQVRQAVRAFSLLFSETDEFVLREVPGGLVGIPVGFADGDVLGDQNVNDFR